MKIYKLPLIIPSLKKDGSIVDLDMRPVIESKLKDLVSKPDIDAIIRNTFNYKLQSPPHLLNIASDKIGDIRNAFYDIYLIYKMELDNLKNKENSALRYLKTNT